MRQRRRRPAGAAEAMASDKKALCAQAALADTRAVDPVLLDMRDLTLITDYFLICHGTSNVHIRALADAVVEALREHSIRPNGIEGYDDARWVLLDYGDLIVHIFAAEQREFYDLERLWSDARTVSAPERSARDDA
jgi:ribosome-associated protein